MNKKETIEHLEKLKSDCKEFVSIETKEEDVIALEVAIAVLKRSAPEVPVQEQLIGLLEGMTLSEWEKLKICIDREFKSQANKTIFQKRDTFKQILELEVIH